MNQFQTIVHKENNTTEMHHGIVLEHYDGGFKFGFRHEGRNYIWNCDYTYWTLK